MQKLPIVLPSDCAEFLQQKTEEIWRDGFVKFPAVLSGDEVEALRTSCDQFFGSIEPWEQKSKDIRKQEFHPPAFGDENWAVLMNLPGRSEKIDEILENFFSKEDISSFLKLMLGNEYKLWELGIRRATAHDKGLYVHQDSSGEFGISILLKDQDCHSGTTSFVRGSHRFGVRASDAKAEFYLKPSILKHFSEPAKGQAGDVFLFFKDTWHGRTQSFSEQNSDAIMMSLFPKGFSYEPFVIPKNVLKSLPSNLFALLSVDQTAEEGTKTVDQKKIVNKYTRLIDCLENEQFKTRKYLRALPTVNRLLLKFRALLKNPKN